MAFTLINPLYPRPHIAAGSANTVAAGFLLTVSSSSSATSFTTSNFDSNCEMVFLDVQSNPVICTFDGSTPLFGTSGHMLASGTNYTWQLGTLVKAKFTAQTASGTATIYASQFSM